MCKYKIENILLKQKIEEQNKEIKRLFKTIEELVKKIKYNEESVCDSECCNNTICNFD